MFFMSVVEEIKFFFVTTRRSILYVYTYTCIIIYMCVCIYIYIYIYIYMYVFEVTLTQVLGISFENTALQNICDTVRLRLQFLRRDTT